MLCLFIYTKSKQLICTYHTEMDTIKRVPKEVCRLNSALQYTFSMSPSNDATGNGLQVSILRIHYCQLLPNESFNSYAK